MAGERDESTWINQTILDVERTQDCRLRVKVAPIAAERNFQLYRIVTIVWILSKRTDS